MAKDLYPFAAYLAGNAIVKPADNTEPNWLLDQWEQHGVNYVLYCLGRGYEYEDISIITKNKAAELYLTTAQTAQRFGVSRKTVLAWIEKRRMPDAKKFGRDWMIPLSAKRPVDLRYVDNPQRNRRKSRERDT